MQFDQDQIILAWRRRLLVAACGGGGGGASRTEPSPRVVATAAGRQEDDVRHRRDRRLRQRHSQRRALRHVRARRSASRIGPATMADLRVGHVVRIEARSTTGARRVPGCVEQHRLLQGMVQAVDVAAGTVTVAGQVVRVDDDTSFDDSIARASLAGIAVGDRIEVHGFSSSNGQARATRIEKPASGDLEVEVTGIVPALDAAARRFSVGTLGVDYSTATLEGFGSAGLRDGDLVEVKGRELLADGTLRRRASKGRRRRGRPERRRRPKSKGSSRDLRRRPISMWPASRSRPRPRRPISAARRRTSGSTSRSRSKASSTRPARWWQRRWCSSVRRR